MKYGGFEELSVDQLLRLLEQDFFKGGEQPGATFSYNGGNLEVCFDNGSKMVIADYFNQPGGAGPWPEGKPDLRLPVDSYSYMPSGNPEPENSFFTAKAEPDETGDDIYVNRALEPDYLASGTGLDLLYDPQYEPNRQEAPRNRSSAAEARADDIQDMNGDADLLVDHSRGAVRVEAVLDGFLLSGDDDELVTALGSGAADIHIVKSADAEAFKSIADWVFLHKQVSYNGVAYEVFENNGEYLLIQNGLL